MKSNSKTLTHEILTKLNKSIDFLNQPYWSLIYNNSKLEKSNNIRTEDRVFVSMDGDNIGASVERAAMANDLTTIMNQSQLIANGQKTIRAWANKFDADIYIDGGDDLAFTLPEKYVEYLDDLRRQYKETTNFTITIGVGDSISHAGHAMLYGKLHGKDQVNVWCPELDEELNEISRELSVEEKMNQHGLLGKSEENSIKLISYYDNPNKTDDILFTFLNDNNSDLILSSNMKTKYKYKLDKTDELYDIGKDHELLLSGDLITNLKKEGYVGFYNSKSPIPDMIGIVDTSKLQKDDEADLAEDYYGLNNENDNNPQESKYTPISFALNTQKIRQLRDLVEQNGGVMSFREIERQTNKPFNSYNLNFLKDSKGNIHSKDLQAHLEKLPKLKFLASHSSYHGQDILDALNDPSNPMHSQMEQFYNKIPELKNSLISQQHSGEPSKVFRLSITPEQKKSLEDAGVYDTFRNMNKITSQSMHPNDPENGIGWVRYTEGDDGIHIDEIQSDFSKHPKANLENQIEMSKRHGLMDENQANHLRSYLNQQVSPEAFNKIKNILFQGNDPTNILHDSFEQYLRDSGKIGTNVHIWQAKSKGDLAGMDTSKPLPGHIQHTYNKLPKKAGYKEGIYGDLSTQSTHHKEPPKTWKKTLRKMAIFTKLLETLQKSELQKENK